MSIQWQVKCADRHSDDHRICAHVIYDTVVMAVARRGVPVVTEGTVKLPLNRCCWHACPRHHCPDINVHNALTLYLIPGNEVSLHPSEFDIVCIPSHQLVDSDRRVMILAPTAHKTIAGTLDARTTALISA